MKRKLVDDLCQNWTFDKQNFNNIIIKVNDKEYSRKIYKASFPEYAYIIYENEKYYFE
jgi:hypothetical protein